MSSSNLGTFYVFDPNSNQFVPYKPDYSAGIPITDFEMVRQKQTAKQREPIRDNQLGIIVPLIHTQPRQSDWAQLASIAQRYPRVNTIAVVSPSQDTRGIEDIGPDPEFSNAVRFLQNASVQVVGYINADDGSKQFDSVRQEIDRWREWYPSVNGIFLDNTHIDANGVSYGSRLATYAKVDKGFQLVLANLAATTNGGVVNSQDDFVDSMKGVDTFIIYEREGYPADGWYPSMKKEWMSKYPRSKFAFVVYRVGTETLPCRNFIDKCVGIEKSAGYVYVQAGSYPDDRRKMREWSNISPLTEITIDALSNLALTEGVPSTKGVVPEKTVIDTSAGLESGRGSQSQKEQPESITTRQDMQFDKFGVRKIYPSILREEGDNKGAGGAEWYLFEENPRADVNLKGLPDKLTREPDGSWSTTTESRLEAWSPKGRQYLNVEITGYFYPVDLDDESKGQTPVIQQCARTGSITGKNKNEGAGYKGKLMANGMVAVGKDIETGVSAGNNRGTTQALTRSLNNQWVGMKTIVYNYNHINQKTGKNQTFVGLEIWVDTNCTDENGHLVVRNDWKPIMHMNDEGGWIAKGKSKKGKGKKNVPNDTILTSPGGTKDQNCVAFEWASKLKFKHLSVREIERVSPD